MKSIENTKNCPLCQQDNSCRAAQRQNDCWCRSLIIPQGLLDELAEKDIDVRCICKQCITRYTEAQL